MVSYRVLTRVALSLALTSPLAFADPTEDQKKEARNLMAEGREQREEKKFADALESFRKAHTLMGVPTTGIEVAKTALLMGKLVEAREAADEVAKSVPRPKEPEPFVAARAEAQRMSEELDKRIPTISVKLKGVKPGDKIEVRVDERVVGDYGKVRRNPGKHVVSATAGKETKSADVDLEEGKTAEVPFDFTPPPPKKAEPEPPPPPPPPPPPDTSWKLPTYGGFGVAGVGLLVGTITGLGAKSKASSAKEQCVDNRCPPSAHADIDGGKSQATLSTLSFGVAIIGAGVGFYGLTKKPKAGAPPKTDEESRFVRPYVGAGSAGVFGQF